MYSYPRYNILNMGSQVDIPPHNQGPRILFIDAFDSFSNNIVGMLQQCLGTEVVVVHMNNSTVSDNLEMTLAAFEAVVVGPGPGHPGNPQDIGFIDRLWNLSEHMLIPVLGICLGFQSLCLSQGANVEKLLQARHGIVSRPEHVKDDIFQDVEDLETTQYHSLYADIGRLGSPEDNAWKPTNKCPSLRPLAWDLSDKLNGPILMAVRHTHRPFWGVQFHPESICTSLSGRNIISNWWKEALTWSYQRQRRVSELPNKLFPVQEPPTTLNGRLNDYDERSHLANCLRSISGPKDIFVRWGRHSIGSVTATSLVEALGLSQDEIILLDRQDHARGRFSILGLVIPEKTMKISYRVTEKKLRYGTSTTKMHTASIRTIEEVWPILQEALDLHDPRQGSSSRASTPGSNSEHSGLDSFVAGHPPLESPFWGGLMGYISYEAGLETINVDLHESCTPAGIPDINFAFIHRSIVIDHQKEQIFIQSLLPGDWAWILNVGRTIDDMTSRNELHNGVEPARESSLDAKEEAALTAALADVDIQRPTETAYRSKVLKCQEFLASGDSYELCLTDETEIRIPEANALNPWSFYKRLRANNSAPFGAFMRLSDVTVAGSSPELFLKWDRDGRCQFRPIKGTVKKGPHMTRELAHEILGSSKERAENLMIVDLIRHDLCGVVGADNSWVSDLMVIEEYETVYQLVSVIEGQLPMRGSDTNGPRGLDALKASLPPGSMTGAPKKRSCEILRDIECRPRGIYSGVLGYMDVGGSGSFSVVIRTALRNDKRSDQRQPHDQNGTNGHTESNGMPTSNGTPNGISNGASNRRGLNGGARRPVTETWRVGAGGAVTIQSTDEGEFLEMETKASSVLGALFPSGSA